MTERYDAVERNVGISSYASPATDNPGFAAVVKARYSDFLVHEGMSCTNSKDIAFSDILGCGASRLCHEVVNMIERIEFIHQTDDDLQKL